MSKNGQEYIPQDDLEEILEEVVSKENVEEAKIIVERGSVKGDGYMGIVNAVEVKGRNKTLHVVVKVACKSEIVRKNMPLREAFLREIYFYEKIFPAFQKFQKDCALEAPFDSVPKFYSSCTEERKEGLVMENIKENGFCLWDRKIPVHEQHIELVLKEYAKFHAIGYAMKKINPDLWNGLSDNMVDVFASLDNKGISFFESQLDDLMKNFGHELNANEREKIALCKSGLTELVDSIVEKEEHSTITHGDCWINNMMFKYEDVKNPKKPTRVCFLDFQVVRPSSPVLDISYFLSTAWTEEHKNDLTDYLNFYYENLQKNIEKYRCDPSELYPRSVLEKDCRNYFRYGFLMSLIVQKAILANQDEIPDIRQTETEGKHVNDLFCFEMAQNDTYKKRIKTLISYLIKNNFL